MSYWKFRFHSSFLSVIKDTSFTGVKLFVWCSIKNYSHIFIFSISSLVPGEPQNVQARAINSSSVEVTWSPPVENDKNGVIRGYQIFVQPKNVNIWFLHIFVLTLDILYDSIYSWLLEVRYFYYKGWKLFIPNYRVSVGFQNKTIQF